MQGEIDKLKGEQIQIDYPAQFKTRAMLEQVLTEPPATHSGQQLRRAP